MSDVMDTLVLGFEIEHRDNNGDRLQVREGELLGEHAAVGALAPGERLNYSVTQGRGVLIESAARPEAPTHVTVTGDAHQVMCVLLRRQADGERVTLSRNLTPESLDSRKTQFLHQAVDRDTALVICVPGEEELVPPEWPCAAKPVQAEEEAARAEDEAAANDKARQAAAHGEQEAKAMAERQAALDKQTAEQEQRGEELGNYEEALARREENLGKGEQALARREEELNRRQAELDKAAADAGKGGGKKK